MGILGMEHNAVLIGGPMSVIGRILMWYISFFRNPGPSVWFRIKTQEGISLPDKFRKREKKDFFRIFLGKNKKLKKSGNRDME
jgi:hypothetical protein